MSVIFPPLTEDRRKEIVKEVAKMGEDAKVAIRNARRDANDEAKKLNKAGELSDDDLKAEEEDIQKTTDKYIKQIDEMVAVKTNEIMTI